MFRGAMVALVTPFQRNGAVDVRALDALVDWQIREGIDALVPCGTTGEAVTLTPAERAAVIRRVVRRARGRVPVIAGAGANSTAEALAHAQAARRAGADSLLVVTPAYNKPTQAGLIAHYTRIARAVPLPLLLYNVPSRTAVSLAPGTVAVLARLPRVAGIKEAEGMAQATRVMALSDLPVISGDDDLTVPMMAIGAVGVISVTANVVPSRVKAMVLAAEQGDWARARILHHKVHALTEACFWETSPGPVKALLAMMGRCGPTMREPLVPPGAQTQRRLKRLLKAEGLL
jgi:4-hydroxy-tetrahydrodipicolinate synthase